MGSDLAVTLLGFRPCEISIHAPRMGSDALDLVAGEEDFISIHAPRMGSDHMYSFHWPSVS